MKIDRPKCGCGAEIELWGGTYCLTCHDLLANDRQEEFFRRQARESDRRVRTFIRIAEGEFQRLRREG